MLEPWQVAALEAALPSVLAEHELHVRRCRSTIDSPDYIKALVYSAYGSDRLADVAVEKWLEAKTHAEPEKLDDIGH